MTKEQLKKLERYLRKLGCYHDEIFNWKASELAIIADAGILGRFAWNLPDRMVMAKNIPP